MSVLIFFLVLFVLVLVHEWGHFFVAKKTGMRVDEFGIGFPPKVFGWRKGETEYTFNLLPIGGFVRIFGEDPDQHEESEAAEGSFSSKSKWAQAAVLIAGIAMNIIFAWMLFVVASMMGVQSIVSEEEAGADARLVITSVLPESPAAAADIPAGVAVTSVRAGSEELTMLTPTAFTEFVAAHPEESLQIAYTRAEETVEVTTASAKGVMAEDPDRAVLGVALGLAEVVSQPLHVALYESAIYTAVSLKQITIGITTLLWDAIRLDADLSQVAGPVGIVGLVDDASSFGITALLMFTAFISLNLAIINILPFPALDGGRLLFVAIEAIKGSPITPRVAQTLNTLGFVLLLLLMAAVTWNDIARLL